MITRIIRKTLTTPIFILSLLGCVRSIRESTVLSPGTKMPGLEHVTMTCQFGELKSARPLCSTGDQRSCIRRFLPDRVTGVDTGKEPLLNPKSPVLPVVRDKEKGPHCRTPKEPTADLWVEATGTFKGADQKNIAYRIIRKALPNENLPMVVILTGYNESYLNYMETAADFLNGGFEVAMMDHRGMGLSERLTSNPNMGHIDDFSNYVQDATFFVKNIVNKRPDKTLLLAHSTGGLVGAHMMAQNPDLFARAVMISPLMELKTGSVPAMLTCAIVNLCSVFGKGLEYPPGCSLEKDRAIDFATNVLTHDETRFRIKKGIRHENPQSELGPPSNLWLQRIFTEIKPTKITKLARSIKNPILILQAEDDRVVGAEGQKLFCSHAQGCSLVPVKDAFHGIHIEKNEIRSEFLKLSFDFFKKN